MESQGVKHNKYHFENKKSQDLTGKSLSLLLAKGENQTYGLYQILSSAYTYNSNIKDENEVYFPPIFTYYIILFLFITHCNKCY